MYFVPSQRCYQSLAFKVGNIFQYKLSSEATDKYKSVNVNEIIINYTTFCRFVNNE